MRSHPEKPGTLGPEEPRLRCRKKAWQGNPVTQRRADLDAESPMASGGATAFGHRVLSRKAYGHSERGRATSRFRTAPIQRGRKQQGCRRKRLRDPAIPDTSLQPAECSNARPLAPATLPRTARTEGIPPPRIRAVGKHTTKTVNRERPENRRS